MSLDYTRAVRAYFTSWGYQTRRCVLVLGLSLPPSLYPIIKCNYILFLSYNIRLTIFIIRHTYINILVTLLISTVAQILTSMTYFVLCRTAHRD